MPASSRKTDDARPRHPSAPDLHFSPHKNGRPHVCPSTGTNAICGQHRPRRKWGGGGHNVSKLCVRKRCRRSLKLTAWGHEGVHPNVAGKRHPKVQKNAIVDAVMRRRFSGYEDRSPGVAMMARHQKPQQNTGVSRGTGRKHPLTRGAAPIGGNRRRHSSAGLGGITWRYSSNSRLTLASVLLKGDRETRGKPKLFWSSGVILRTALGSIRTVLHNRPGHTGDREIDKDNDVPQLD
jgi:hypothetical protein